MSARWPGSAGAKPVAQPDGLLRVACSREHSEQEAQPQDVAFAHGCVSRLGMAVSRLGMWLGMAHSSWMMFGIFERLASIERAVSSRWTQR